MAATIKTRTAAKGWLTRSVKQFEELTSHGKKCDPLVLEEGISEFNKRLESVDQAQAAVEVAIEEDKLETDIQEAGDFREFCIRVRQAAGKLLLSLKTKSSDDKDDIRSNLSDTV